MKLRRTLIDNSKEGYNMTEVLKECLKDKNVTEVYIATGFWDLRGTALVYEELAEFLSREGSKFRLLIGKDPYLYSADTESFTKGRYDKQEQAWRVDLDKFAAQEQYVKVVQMLVDNLKDKDNEKFQIHIYKPDGELKDQFLHSKCYIFKGYDHEEECKVGYGIIGSTNFTQRGMEGNSELNTLEINARDVISLDPEFKKDKTHLLWFNEKWEDSVSWEKEFLLQITQSKMAPDITIPEPKEDEIAPLTPYEVYIKYLQMQFGDITDESVSTQLKSYLPNGFQSLGYQLDAVKQCFHIMKDHGGFFLSDVVGLGKTIVGVLVIKKFITEAAEWSRLPKVLIVTPPAIKKGWIDTIDLFDEENEFKIKDHVEFITTGSIGSLIDTDEIPDEDGDSFEDDAMSNDYGMIIIDESHNFRNSDTQKYSMLDNLIDRITLKTGIQPLIGLLSATPQNNAPADLKNQIYFFQRSHNATTLPDIPGGKLDSYFNEMQKEFSLYRNDDSPEAKEAIKLIAADIHDKVLQYLMVRRTRSDIKTLYENDSQQLKFPSVKGPKPERYTMGAKLSKLFYDTVYAIIGRTEEDPDTENTIGYYRYSAISYLVNEEDKKIYEKRNLTAEGISQRLAHIMQLLLVKRLESSFSAFRKSLDNLRRNTQYMIEMLEADTVFICPDLDINNIIEEEGGLAKATPVIRKKMEPKSDKNREFRSAQLKKDEYLNALRQDLTIITDLCKRWEKNTEDPKLDKFKAILDTELFNPKINNPHGYDKPRLVIFTEAVDTLETINDYVQSVGHRPLKVSAKDRDEKQKEIAENFDANIPEDLQKDDFDVIITTEVLAEGVNLHRANVILNYDAPWNATRLMQRIGRVNRIGSKEDFVHVFNFYPSDDGEKIIKYQEKAYAKLQSFHTMFGEDNKVFSEMEELSEADLNSMVDGETSPFAPYINELKQYAAEHPERFKQICETEPRQLGNFRVCNLGQHLFYVSAENHHSVHILLDEEGNYQIASPLRFIQSFKMTDENEKAAKADIAKYEEKAVQAVNAFNTFVSQSKKAKDAKKIKDSMKQWQSIFDMLSDTDAKKAMKNVRKAIEAQNTIAIKLTNQLYKEVNQGEQSLFGLNADVNEYVKSTFNNISQEVKKQHGEPYVSIYQISTDSKE